MTELPSIKYVKTKFVGENQFATEHTEIVVKAKTIEKAKKIFDKIKGEKE